MATPEGLVRLIELLAEALKKLPDLTQGLRAGSTTHLEIRLSQAVPAAVEEILKCNENDQATLLATFYVPLQAAILKVAPDLKARLKVCLATLSVIQEKTLSMQKLINLLTAIDGVQQGKDSWGNLDSRQRSHCQILPPSAQRPCT
eukprot:2232741-Pyramimonas_sp.AAC.1